MVYSRNYPVTYQSEAMDRSGEVRSCSPVEIKMVSFENYSNQNQPMTEKEKKLLATHTFFHRDISHKHEFPVALSQHHAKTTQKKKTV